MKTFKHAKKVIALIVTLALCLSMMASVFAADEDESADEEISDLGDFGDDTGAMSGGSTSEMPSEEYTYLYYSGEDEVVVSDLAYYSDDFAASGVAATDCTTVIVGGDTDNYTAAEIAELSETTATYINTYASGESFNSYIVLEAETDSTGTLTTAGDGIAVDSGVLYVTNTYIQTSGNCNNQVSGRYGIATMGTAVSVINDSYVVQTGPTELTSGISAPPSNGGLLISGNARANFSIGATTTMYFNSTVITEGWAAMSTDSANNPGLYFYSYNSTAIAENGGYGVYADSGCSDYLYATTIEAAEIGIIISNNGAVTIGSGEDAESVNVLISGEETDALLSYNTGVTTTEGSVIYGDRNAVQIHSPSSEGDMVTPQGTLTVSNSTLTTVAIDGLTERESDEDYASEYDEAVAAYVEYIYGSVILVKSTGAIIDLDNVEMYSSNGILIHTIINSDSSSRYLSEDTTEDYQVEVTMTDMDVEGSIQHDDYQREINLTLTNTTLTGASYQGTAESWAELWEGYDEETYSWCYWTDELFTDYDTTTHYTNITLTEGSVWYVTDDSVVGTLDIDATSSVVVAAGVTLTVTSGDNAGEYTGETLGAEVAAEDTSDSEEEVITTSSAIVVGSNGNEANAPKYASYVNESVTGITLEDTVSWHNGLVFYGGTGYDNEGGVYYVTGAEIIMDTDADGSDTSDFGGLGAAVAAIGDGITLYITDSYIETTGVAKLALYTDDGAVSIVTNSTLISNGGVVYDGYYSTADTTMMVTPPWVLGLGGDETEGVNARTTNIMGTNSVGVYIDSYFYASGWGALSTDNGSANTMIVINTTVEVENSGYGAYTIGETTEEYYGATMDVSTYAIIMTGGEATFESYTAGQEIGVYKMDGDADEYGINTEGTLVTTVTSSAVVEGTVYSEIVSDNFGFMCHSNGSTGYNVINILDGTSVTATDAIFLIKKINAVITVDNATLESTEKGVILQIIDNDDDYIGVDATLEWGMDDEYGHSYGSHMPSFNQTFSEEDGYSNEWIADTAAAALYESGEYDTADNWTVDYTMTNTTVEGDIWNSSGYVGSNAATTLNVTLGEGADLTGLISAGAFSHDTKYAEVGDGDWSGASALGHVTNIVNSNGVNIVNVTLTDDAVWTVTEDSYVDTLTVEGSASVVIADGVTLTVGDTTYESGVVTADGYTEASDETTDDSSAAEVGDFSNLALWIVLAAFAVAAAAAAVSRRRLYR